MGRRIAHFQIPQGIFRPPVMGFDAGLRGIGAPVEFQVELAPPDRHRFGSVVQPILEAAEEIGHPAIMDRRHPRQFVQDANILNLFPRRPAAAIAVTVGQQQLVIDRFVRVNMVGADDGVRCHIAVIGILPLRRILVVGPGFDGRDEVG